MKNTMIIFLLLITNACGKQEPIEVDGFEHEVNLFNVEAGKRFTIYNLSGLKIEFEDELKGFSPTTAGVCTYGARKIAVRRSWWDKANAVNRELLIFHEMGHCILMKQHQNTCPNIMCPSINEEMIKAYLTNRKKMLDELFKTD